MVENKPKWVVVDGNKQPWFTIPLDELNDDEMHEIVQMGIKTGGIAIIHAKGEGYTMYAIDLVGYNRILVEVYDEMDEMMIYHQTCTKPADNALNVVHTPKYKQKWGLV